MSHQLSTAPLEMWAGVECTVNRVGDQYFDQLECTGHANRVTDIQRFSEPGVRTMRYPVLWERLAPQWPDPIDWTWADERLGLLRDLGIRPIAGLLHHGHGPASTSLIDPQFPAQLAAYAGAVQRPLLIAGALAQAFAQVCAARGLPHHLLARHDIDIADPPSVAAALDRWQPWAIINAAGYIRLDDAEREAPDAGAKILPARKFWRLPVPEATWPCSRSPRIWCLMAPWPGPTWSVMRPRR